MASLGARGRDLVSSWRDMGIFQFCTFCLIIAQGNSHFVIDNVRKMYLFTGYSMVA